MNESELEKDLKAHLAGDVHFDEATKTAYSVDASIFEVQPMCICAPINLDDLLKTLVIAKKYSLSVIPRGAATGITGGCLGHGLIIDLSRHFTSIIEINYEQEYVICEPGVIQDDLNNALADRGFRLGPDTSTGNRATIGGMLANNSVGARSLRYGKMVDHVQEVELVLVDGTIITFGDIDTHDLELKLTEKSIEGAIYRQINVIRTFHANEIEKNFPKLPRRVSGYNLDELIKSGPLNVAKLIAGSEGSLGIATKIRLKIVKKEQFTTLCVVHFDDLLVAFEHVPAMKEFSSLALELIDAKIIEMGRLHPILKNKLDWLNGNPQALVVAEFDGVSEIDVIEKVNRFNEFLNDKKIGYACSILNNKDKMAQVWEVRKSGLGLVLSKRTYSRAIAFIEDISIPPDELSNFMRKFLNYLKSVGKEAGIYGHVGSGCMHIRPYIDLRKDSELALMKKMMWDVSDLLLEHGGALSGEHGDGYLRTWLNEKMFGHQIYHLFCNLKYVFDPDNRMNPGKVVHPTPQLENLRLSPSTSKVNIETFLDFSSEGGIELAADLCNGNGLCRKKENVMCPSFQATRNEFHTTRARAQGLRAIINGRWPKEEMSGDRLNDLLDLCLECKGCKTECPSQVDMAKMKSEFLYHFQKKHGTPLRSRLFGHIGRIYQMATPMAGLFNRILSLPLTRQLFSYFGIAPERTMPEISRKRLSAWFKTHKLENHRNSVVLFNDTFTEFNQPEIGKAAVKVLQAMSYNVIIPKWSCCGRPLLSKGLLEAAQKKAEKVIYTLIPYAEKGYKIIGLEPSCILTIIDDYAGLVGKKNLEITSMFEKIKPLCITFDEFIVSHLDAEGQLPLKFVDIPQKALVHGHCHQKSLVGMEKTMMMLKALPGYSASEIPSGCCGMAGSFGYEKEHYDISMKIAALKLIPAVEATPASTEIIANGFSCRCQIDHITGRKSLHLAEALAKRLF